MKRIVKDAEPDFWSAFLRKHSKCTYDSLEATEEGRQLRSQVREHMMAHQKMICCYCCRSINLSNSHNEHIKPGSSFPEKSMNYDNLLVSCTSGTCGMAKENHYNPAMFISPLMDDCEEHFRFLPDGRIEGTSAQGKDTNAYSLVQARKQQYKDCCDMARYMGKDYVFTEYIQEKDGCLPRFVDMITYFSNRGDFDPDICR